MNIPAALKNLWSTEPVVVIGLLNAAIALGVSFGLSISVEQKGAVIAFVTAVLTYVQRSRVTPA